MNFFQELISNLQDLVAQVPEIIQPLVIMLAGAIPAIEGDIAAVIGIVGGLNPVVAGLAGAAGNFATVLLTVLLTSRARNAIVTRRERIKASVGATESTAFGSGQPATASDLTVTASSKPESKGRAKGRERLNKWFVRFGVPGASLLGPLALPTQVTSAILVASGSPRAWVLLWQAAAIVIWTTISSVSAWLALMVVFLV